MAPNGSSCVSATFRPDSDIETVTEVGIGSPVWTADSRGIVFTEVNDNWRSYRARLHRLGEPAANDRTLYEETENVAFTVDVGRTQDRRYILISTGENSSNEVRIVPADNARGAAGADRPAPAADPIFGRCQPRQIVDPDQ